MNQRPYSLMFLWQIIWEIVQKVSLSFVDLTLNKWAAKVWALSNFFLSIVPELNKPESFLKYSGTRRFYPLSFIYVLYASNSPADFTISLTRTVFTMGGGVFQYRSLIPWCRRSRCLSADGMCKKVSFLPQSASDDKFVLKEIPFVHPLQALLKWTHMFKISMHEVFSLLRSCVFKRQSDGKRQLFVFRYFN